MKPELIVALDVPAVDRIPHIVDSLADQVHWYKVGLELFIAAGPGSLDHLKKRNKKIFLDLKLHDIPNTVSRAVESAGRLGVSMLTVHAGGGKEMLRAAADTAHASTQSTKVVAVTVLTSLDQEAIAELGVSGSLTDHAMRLGELAVAAGVDGLVCSPWEAPDFRAKLGAVPVLVTPGIRPAGADTGDQKRVATPEIAVRAGATFLVVGRPILQAPDPATAVRDILSQINTACTTKS